jgi:hypothetical protein
MVKFVCSRRDSLFIQSSIEQFIWVSGRMMKRIYFVICCLWIGSMQRQVMEASGTPPPLLQFAKGADVGWLTQMEAAGKRIL